MNELLKALRAEVPGTRTSFIVTIDGFMIASDIGEDIDQYEIGKLISSMEQKGQKFAASILKASGTRFAVWSEKGDIQLFPLKNSTILFVLSDSDSRPGLLQLRVAKIIEIIESVINNEDI
ncbi:MAG: hypothetical protein KAS21_03745 [Candidatus Aminicenantes bacterium]|nr:hypothetical protein [Candidatus Aminicenantes bacterium]